MNSKYKYFVSAALSGLFGLLVAFSANAQHRGGGGGGAHGGGGSRGGGGGFHGSPGGGFHGSPGGSRPSVRSTPSARGPVSVRGGSPSIVRRPTVTAGVGGRVSVVSPRGGVVARSYGRGVYAPGRVYRGGVYGRGPYGRGIIRNRFYGRTAFYNRYYLPRIGFHLSVLPYGYYPFYWGDYQYFYSDGYYYQHNDNDYSIVEPPVGAILNQLPAGANSIMIDGQQYYELNGVYYQAVTQSDGSTGYQIAGKDGELTTAAGDQSNADGAAAPQVGDIVSVLPADCNTVKINGQKYYVSPDGYYYQDDVDSSNNKVYRVAGTPTDEPSN